MKRPNLKKLRKPEDPGKVIIGSYTVPTSTKSGKAIVGYFTAQPKSGNVIIGMFISGLVNPNIVIS